MVCVFRLLWYWFHYGYFFFFRAKVLVTKSKIFARWNSLSHGDRRHETFLTGNFRLNCVTHYTQSQSQTNVDFMHLNAFNYKKIYVCTFSTKTHLKEKFLFLHLPIDHNSRTHSHTLTSTQRGWGWEAHSLLSLDFFLPILEKGFLSFFVVRFLIKFKKNQ